MVIVKRIKAGVYSVSDGRYIVKDGASWYIQNGDGSHAFGPVTTLSAAKEYVQTGISSIGQHNLGTAHGRRKSKKEFNAYMASEVEEGNYGPVILYAFIAVALIAFFAFIEFGR